MSRQSHFLPSDVYQYLLKVSSRETELQHRLRRETADLEKSEMQTSPELGQFLQLLVGLTGARRSLEIGVYTGYSALAVALALPEDGRIVACDVSETWTAVARRYWREAGVNQKIDLHLAPALDTLATLAASEPFDLAFIDADKGNYLAYYQEALRLLRPGGLVVIDNVLWNGRVADDRDQDPETVAIRELNDALSQDPRIDLSLLPVGDGITLARKRG